MAVRTDRVYKILIWTERRLSTTPVGKLLKKIRPAVYAYRLLYKASRPFETIVTTIRGHRVHLDPVDLDITRHVLLDYGSWEAKETEVFLSFVGPGKVVVDVGANFGYYTLLAAGAVGPEGKIYSFEPSPRNYSLLAKNVRENNYSNIEAIPKAVSNHTGSAELFLSSESSGGHKLSGATAAGDSVSVETVALDDFFAEMPHGIDILKLDAEGAEDMVLDGMQRVLEKSPNMVLFTEFYPKAMRNFGRSPENYVRRLIDYGFHIDALDEIGGTVFTVEAGDIPGLVERLCREGAPSNLVNLVCVRGSHVQGEVRPGASAPAQVRAQSASRSGVNG